MEYDIKTALEVESNGEIDWSTYSEHYDEMCFANPAYLANLDELINRVPSWNLPENPTVCDVGAGTGSYIVALSELLPNGEFFHLDFDASMTTRAKEKYAQRHLPVKILQQDVRKIEIPESTFDLCISVNTIYSIPEHDDVLKKMRSWTRPGGKLFIIDFGRKVEILDWALFILRSRVKEKGLRDTIRWYRENSENLRQNRRGAKAQSVGTYWLHSTEEFKNSLSNAGWKVDDITTCYRDCCDLAVCTNPP